MYLISIAALNQAEGVEQILFVLIVGAFISIALAARKND